MRVAAASGAWFFAFPVVFSASLLKSVSRDSVADRAEQQSPPLPLQAGKHTARNRQHEQMRQTKGVHDPRLTSLVCALCVAQAEGGAGRAEQPQRGMAHPKHSGEVSAHAPTAPSRSMRCLLCAR